MLEVSRGEATAPTPQRPNPLQQEGAWDSLLRLLILGCARGNVGRECSLSSSQSLKDVARTWIVCGWLSILLLERLLRLSAFFWAPVAEKPPPRPLCGQAFFMVDDVAFLVTSSNSFPLPISIARDLSGLSFSQPELIQVPISEEQKDSNDAAISLLWPGVQRGEGSKSWGPSDWSSRLLPFVSSLPPTVLHPHKADNGVYLDVKLDITFFILTQRNKDIYLRKPPSTGISPDKFETLGRSLLNWDVM